MLLILQSAGVGLQQNLFRHAALAQHKASHPTLPPLVRRRIDLSFQLPPSSAFWLLQQPQLMGEGPHRRRVCVGGSLWRGVRRSVCVRVSVCPRLRGRPSPTGRARDQGRWACAPPGLGGSPRKQGGRSATCGAPDASLWGGASPGPRSPRPSPGGARPRPRPQPEPAPPAEPGSPNRAAEPRRRQRPWDAGIAPPGPLSLRPLPRALCRAEPASRCSRPPRGAGRGPSGERAPPASRSPPRPCVHRRPTFLPDGPEPPGRVPSTRQPLSQRGEGRERRRWPGPGVPWGVPVRRGSPPVPSPSGFPVRCRGPGDGELRPRLPDHRWRRLAEGLGLGPGFPRPETPRSEQPQGARRMCLSRAGGERAERTPASTREQAERSFSLGPGAWGDPATGQCPGLDEISAPQEGICARYRGGGGVSSTSVSCLWALPPCRDLSVLLLLEAVASPLVSVGSERAQMSGHGNSGEFFVLLALTWTDSLTLTGEGGISVPLCYLTVFGGALRGNEGA
ncbi:hypothetical protein LEMLEM_LOCUS22106 [Lemmus lemmus]